MIESTLPIWKTVLIMGVALAALGGYLNQYVPEEQRQKAEKIKQHAPDVGDCFVKYSQRISQLWYVVNAIFVSTGALVFFIFEEHKRILTTVTSLGIVGGAFVMILIACCYLFSIVALIFISCFSECYAVDDAKSYYWRHYQAMLISED